ncbi:ketopantoate reductase family protein [Natrarchaeobaculum aegyptiacum]|uniref:2-dehydropantoate 2-reductase n=1 Tax=Natrarchaeobaculum aegyptiacum TaxID=745377 RepID=A0A2Z2HRJ5_9EURY|nr:2-dehydropantoate 2-reductase [Natrarchaeobaculum aegyptiacum]ARS89780.1 2-dehydropantoate 2-reductase [Natrarchaeobaculum aegyptiacum]
MEIVVFGAGSLGSLVGGVLARAHEVTLVGRPDHVDALRSDGLRVTGQLEAHVTPSATTDGRDLAAELAVVTVKAADTPTAADALATGTFDAALSLQNGMGNEAILADALESPVLAGTATYGALRREPGVVDCTGLGEVVVGPRDDSHSPLATRVGNAFQEAGLETTVADDIPRRLWEKLAVNAAINPVTALADADNGAILDPPAADVAHAAARETARVARGAGISLTDEAAVGAVSQVARDTAANTSSMRQDVRAGRRTEIDAINGYVVDRAEELGLAVPTNRVLASLIRTWERSNELR